MKNAKKYGVLAPLSAAFCATVLTITGGVSANVSYASTAAANVVGSSSTGSNDANSQIKFEDENLKKALLKTMKNQRLIADNASEITYGDAKKLYHADITYGNITNLSGIENFTALNRIDFDHNNISDLSPLSSIIGLESIYASYNKISNLTPLKSLSSLECLRANDNKITDFSTIQNLTNLKTLYLGDNSDITNFNPLKKFTNLTDLNLDETKFSDLNIIKDLKNLKLLYLQAANVSDLSPISSLTKLTSLRLYGNKITSITPLKSLTELADLGLEYNKGITDFTPLSSLTNLTSLSLAGNNIKAIDLLKTLKKLNYIDVGYNDIKDFSVLKSLQSLSRASIGGQTLSLNSEEPSTSLDIDFSKNLTFTANSTNAGSVKDGSFVLSASSLPYEGDVTIKFNNNGKSFTIGGASIDAGKYSGIITLHLNVPKIEIVKGKMKYDSSSDLKYGEKKVITKATDGTKKIYKDKKEVIITPAQDGVTEVGNKEIVTEDIEPGTTYKADSSLAYQATKEIAGTKGTRTVENFHSVDPNTGAIGRVSCSNIVTTTNATNTVIKIGNVKTENNDIPFKTTYVADDTLAYQETNETAGKKGSKTVTTTYKVDKTTGLTTNVESTNEETTTNPIDHVIRVGNKQVKTETIAPGTTYKADSSLAYKATSETAGEAGTKTTTTIYKVNKDTGLTNNVEGTPTEAITKAVKNKVIKVGNVKSETTYVDFGITYEDDATLDAGTEQTKSEGKKGSKTVTTTYEVDPVNGLTQTITNTTTTEVNPTNKVVRRGTKKNPPKPPQPNPDPNPDPNTNPNPDPNPNPNPDPNNPDTNNPDPSSDPDPHTPTPHIPPHIPPVIPPSTGFTPDPTQVSDGPICANECVESYVTSESNENPQNPQTSQASQNPQTSQKPKKQDESSKASKTEKSYKLSKTGAGISGAAFASFGSLVLGLVGAVAAASRKRAKHLR